MKISKKEKKVMIIMIVITVLLCLTAILFLHLNYRVYYVREANEKNDVTVTSVDLTDSQKLSDFDFLCQTIDESMAFKNEYELITKVNFDEYLEKYREKILETETDFDFYAIIYNMISNIPSAHTNIVPSYNQLCMSNIYNTDNICGIKNIDAYLDYWQLLSIEKAEQLRDFEYYPFTYITSDGGKYLYNNITNVSSQFDKNTIIEVNGIDIDEYIISDIYNPGIYFDGINQKYYKSVLIFSNNPDHTPVDLLLQNEKGEKYNETLYADFKYFIIPSALNEDVAIVESVSMENTYFFDDDKNDLSYCFIKRIDSQNKEMVSQILSKSRKNVIIDLRNNGGGNIYSLKEALAPVINESTNYECKWYVPATKQNINAIYFRKLTDRISALINKPYSTVMSDGREMLLFTENMEVQSSAAKQHNVYVLIGPETCSAADRIVNIFLKQPNTVVVGNNTSGEGLGGPAIMSVLPQSRIVFSYYASYPDGNSTNSLLGTAPDHYIYDADYEGYLLCREMFKNGIDGNTYENRLKWDNVLIKTLELIKEDENDKGNNTADE